MKYLLVTLAVFLSLAVAAPAQYYGQQAQYYGQQGFRGVMTAQDQQQFDKYYGKWVDAVRKNDQDDVASNARHMEEIMARYNIPSNVPFDQIASNPVYVYPNGAYPNGTYQGAYSTYGRLSPDDQKKFDKAYAKWIDAQRSNDTDDVVNNVRKMQEIMARYNIPGTVPYQAIATNGYAAAPNGVYVSPYAANPYPAANAYPYGPQQLSAKDQRNFDKAYKHWVDARRKKDMDDVDNNARKMEDIMAKYNIPANVPFDRVASPGAAYH